MQDQQRKRAVVIVAAFSIARHEVRRAAVAVMLAGPAPETNCSSALKTAGSCLQHPCALGRRLRLQRRFVLWSLEDSNSAFGAHMLGHVRRGDLFHVRRSGLALLVAYLLHLIQNVHVDIPA
jgi:hypothetical protein